MKEAGSLFQSRLVRWVTYLVVLVLFGLYLLFPVTMGIIALVPSREAVGAPPPTFAEVTLATADGVALAAWYAPPANGVAIILLHGSGDSREAVRPYAQMLASHGYGVLALDLRGHGASEGRANRFGWESSEDALAAVHYLQQRAEVQKIGALGLSLGGETLLGIAGGAPAVEAIVADGATSRCVDELLALPSERPLTQNFFSRVQFATVALLSGQKPPLPLLDSMLSTASTRYLLVAGGAVAWEVAFNELYAAAVGEQATLWVAPEAGHTGAFARCADEYERRLIAFFDDALLGKRATSGPGRSFLLTWWAQRDLNRRNALAAATTLIEEKELC